MGRVGSGHAEGVLRDLSLRSLSLPLPRNSGERLLPLSLLVSQKP